MPASRGGMSALRIALAALAVAATVAFLVVVSGDRDSAGPEAGDTTLRALLAEPERHLGDVVTVSGEVARLDLRPGAFTIGDRVAPQENELFVLPTRSAAFDPAAVDADSVVRVQGTIRRVTTDDDEDDDLLFDDEEDDAFDEFEGELAIKATRVDVLES